MSTFQEIWGRLQDVSPSLAPKGPTDEGLSQEILAARLFDTNNEMAENCRAGLLLFNNDLDRAHQIVQDVSSSTGSFWHAIIHRREGDFSNARYWWHRTGHHDAFDEIFDIVIHKVPDFDFLDEIREILSWDPVAFTNHCEQAQKGTAETVERLELVQRIEMTTLLKWCESRVSA